MKFGPRDAPHLYDVQDAGGRVVASDLTNRSKATKMAAAVRGKVIMKEKQG